MFKTYKRFDLNIASTRNLREADVLQRKVDDRTTRSNRFELRTNANEQTIATFDVNSVTNTTIDVRVPRIA
jgi:hypothetical protein